MFGDMPLEDGGVAMPHIEVGLHKGSFPPHDELRSQVEFCKMSRDLPEETEIKTAITVTKY